MNAITIENTSESAATNAVGTINAAGTTHSTEDTHINEDPQLTDSVETTAAVVAPPCYFWNVCSQRAAVEKAGRAVCPRCSMNLRGFEYPLRGPSRDPLYPTGHDAAEAMNILD